ncbi:MAG TPA: hypothetical protein VJ420_09030, partial [Candidatus Udaeobacter sp.]|nr:hypothetical protein [Candidatus Udaeobacter sp.]
ESRRGERPFLALCRSDLDICVPTFLSALERMDSAVMLSEAKHLGLLDVDRSRNDQRFFSRDCGIRMTLRP